MKGLVKQAVESCSCDASKSSGQDQSSTREGLNAKHNDI